MRNLWGKDKIQATLENVDRLTKVEGLSAGAQTLGVVHEGSNKLNKMKRLLLFTPPLPAETDSII